MTYFGQPRGRRKALSTVRITTSGGITTLVKDSGTPVNITSSYLTTAWTELFDAASVIVAVNMIEIFETTGNTARLGLGESGLESDLMLMFPGGNGAVSVRIDPGMRIAIRPLTAVSDGTETVINFYD
jgi:hypothetical protein